MDEFSNAGYTVDTRTMIDSLFMRRHH